MSSIPYKDIVRLRHISDASEKIVAFTTGTSRVSLTTDEKLALAVVRLIEIIGEAASKVGDETKAMHQSIPWREMIGMRNRLIHAYEAVDLDIVWKIITEDIPVLQEKIAEILTDIDPQGKLFPESSR
jgi:uncharacterized protein with HEPN domain